MIVSLSIRKGELRMKEELKKSLSYLDFPLSSIKISEDNYFTIISVDIRKHNREAWILATYLNESKYEYSISPSEVNNHMQEVQFMFKKND